MAAAMAVKTNTAVDRIDVKTLVERLDARGRYPDRGIVHIQGQRGRHEGPSEPGPARKHTMTECLLGIDNGGTVAKAALFCDR